MASAKSSEKTSTTSSEAQESKKSPTTTEPAVSKSAKMSLFKRATLKLGTVLCNFSNDTNPNEAPKQDAAKDEESGDDNQEPTMKCQIKHLDRRYNDEDEPYFKEREKDDSQKADKKDWWRLFSFCVVRRYDSDGDLDETCLYINPQPLRQLLKDVIGNYPSDPIDVDDVQIDSPYHSLFHYRKQIESVGIKRFEDAGDDLSHSQLNLLLTWIKSHFELEIAAHEKCVSSQIKAIAYDKLWTLFPPRSIVHSKVQEQNRAFRVLDYYYDDDDNQMEQNPGLHMRVDFIDYDGDNLGTRRSELFVGKYTGTRELSLINVKPLDMLDEDERDKVRAELLTRGRKFEAFVGQHFMQYEGHAIKKDPENPCRTLRFNVSHRVMVDCRTYHRLDANDSFVVDGIEKDLVDGNLSDEDAVIASSMVRGYAFSAKMFLEFFLHKLSPIEWNTNCFDDLVLDAGIKKTVQALVSTHAKKGESSEGVFDDIVKGKGQGLVCVLHGPPGVGKTLTAECVAEYVRRPLFMVSSGDLGVSSGQLDAQLTRIMDMTSAWRAVLLIDEADVFLERRSLHDLHRNAMVSVFLRVLEYYSGILFLTTNRVSTFDDAFKSRIHIPIRYTDLDFPSRLRIWRNFCKLVPGGVKMTDAEYKDLAHHDLNGRQIKNVIKAAESLAVFDNLRVDFQQLDQVTKIQAKFENDLTAFGDIDYTVPGSAKKAEESRNMYC